jgi:hypothetical protein
MKHLFLFLLCLCPCLGYTQALPKNTEGVYAFSDVVPVEGAQMALYQKAKAWLAFEYKAASEVVQVDNPEAGQLIGNGISLLRDGAKLHYTLHLQFKDGRFRWELSNLAYSIGPAKSTAEELLNSKNSYKNNGELRALPKQLITDTHAEVTRLQASLLKALQTDSDW